MSFKVKRLEEGVFNIRLILSRLEVAVVSLFRNLSGI